MKLIIDIDEEIYKSSKEECDENDSLIIDTFTYAIGNGTPLSDKATNGDVIKALFPNNNTDLLGINDISLIDKETETIVMVIHKWWWNAPYKENKE